MAGSATLQDLASQLNDVTNQLITLVGQITIENSEIGALQSLIQQYQNAGFQDLANQATDKLTSIVSQKQNDIAAKNALVLQRQTLDQALESFFQ